MEVDVVRLIELGDDSVNVTLGGDEDAGAVAAAVERSTSLRRLTLGYSLITDVGATRLAEAVGKSTTLRSIRLPDNFIADVGAKALAAAIEKSTSLQDINLRGNQITDVGAAALAAAIDKSTSIENVNLDGNLRINDLFRVTDVSRVTAALERALHRRRLVALACAAEAPRGTPARTLVLMDGDHAIGTRVAWFLLE